MALKIEDVVDGRVGGDEALSLSLGFEPLHLSLASSDRQVGILSPVVVAQPSWIVALLAFQGLQGGPVRSQPVGDKPFRDEALVLEQFPQQFQGCCFVAALLDEDVEDLALAVDGPPHVHAFAVDAHDHLVEMPHAVSASPGAPDVGGDGRAELVGPATHGS